MSNVLQLSVKVLVCGYYGAFQTLRVAIGTCKVYNKQEKDFKIYFLSPVKISLAQKRHFCFLFSSGRLLHQRRTKANHARRRVCMPSICFHERICSSEFRDNISLVAMIWR